MIIRIEQGLLFLVLLFLPTQLGRHFWPSFSYIHSLPVDYLSPTIYFWDILTLLLIFIWLISGNLKKPSKVALNLLFIFLLSQIVYLFVSFINTSFVNTGAGLVRIQQYLICGMFGVYLASQNFDALLKRLYWPTVITVLMQSLLGLAQFINGKTIPHPNVLAAFLLISSILIMISSSSRTTIMASLVAAAFFLKTKWLVLLIVLILVLFSSILDFDSLSLARREQLIQTSQKLFLTSPLIGIGLNNFIPASSNELLVGRSRFLQPVHNIFLLELAETGIIGFLGLCLLIGFPIQRLISSKLHFHHPILLIWLIVIFLGMFDHYFLTVPQGYRLLFVIWGLSLSHSCNKMA